jgi:hypothetical protein
VDIFNYLQYDSVNNENLGKNYNRQDFKFLSLRLVLYNSNRTCDLH